MSRASKQGAARGARESRSACVSRPPCETVLQAHIRPLAFAGTELALDMLHAVRQIYEVDIESAMILLCVNHATMRPMFIELGQDSVPRAVIPPPETRGSISRLMVADKTGLPRETVRRKIKRLRKEGYVTIDEKGRVQITAMLGRPDVRHALSVGHKAVRRYLARLREFNIDPDQDFAQDS